MCIKLEYNVLKDHITIDSIRRYLTGSDVSEKPEIYETFSTNNLNKIWWYTYDIYIRISKTQSYFTIITSMTSCFSTSQKLFTMDSDVWSPVSNVSQYLTINELHEWDYSGFKTRGTITELYHSRAFCWGHGLNAVNALRRQNGENGASQKRRDFNKSQKHARKTSALFYQTVHLTNINQEDKWKSP